MGIQPEKEREGEAEREREEVDMGRARFPRNQFEKLVLETGPCFIVQKGLLYFFVHRDQWII